MCVCKIKTNKKQKLCFPFPRCDCKPGYSGVECEEELDPCENLTCLNGGTCEKLNATVARCRCSAGFEPPDCHAPPSPCESSPCQHGGTCRVGRRGGYTCTCQPEYTGTLCSILAGECPFVVSPVIFVALQGNCPFCFVCLVTAFVIYVPAVGYS